MEKKGKKRKKGKYTGVCVPERRRQRDAISRRTPRISQRARYRRALAEQRITFVDVHNNALCLSTNNDHADPVYLSIRTIGSRIGGCCSSKEPSGFPVAPIKVIVAGQPRVRDESIRFEARSDGQPSRPRLKYHGAPTPAYLPSNYIPPGDRFAALTIDKSIQLAWRSVFLPFGVPARET